MYYIVKVDNRWKAVLYSSEYEDKIYGLLKRCGVEIDGQYGRKEYAENRVKELNKEL